jgi:hypothetical protein
MSALPIHLRLGRGVAAVLACFCLAFVGVLNVGTTDAQPVYRPHVAKLAGASQAPLQARTAGRRRSRLQQVRSRLQQMNRRACVSHKRALCAKSREQLARLDAQSASVGKTRRRRPIHQAAPPAVSLHGTSSFVGSSSSGGSGSSGSSGSFPSDSGSLSEPNPISESPASTTTFQTGIDSGTNMTLDLQGSVLLGAKLVRIEFPIETTPAQMESVIGGYAAKGIRVLLLSTFRGTLPTPAQAQSLAAVAKTYGPGGTFWATHAGDQAAVQSIEFGNETSYGYQYGDAAGDASYRERAENYARRLQEAAEAISATGIHVGLLAQADDWTGDWVNGMYAAVPNLSRYVAGWTIHPYHHWRSRMEDLLEQTAAHGDTTIPIDVTEFGLPNDNGRCLEEDGEYNPCVSYGEAASILRGTVSEMRQMLGSRLGMFILYQVRDQEPTGTSTDSELYYGALQHELQPKGEFTTAVEELLAS